jgi:hypothetical protein
MGTYKNSRIPVWHKALKVFFWGEIPQSNREIKKIVISIFYTGELDRSVAQTFKNSNEVESSHIVFLLLKLKGNLLPFA